MSTEAATTYHLLASGYRSTISLLSFDASTAKLKIVSDSPAPTNASWLERAAPAAGRVVAGHAPEGQGQKQKQEQGQEQKQKQEQEQKQGQGQVLYSLSEVDEGLALSLSFDGTKVVVTGQKGTQGGPAHVHATKDGKGVVVANYVGGSIIYLPIDNDGKLSETSQSPPLKFPFVYEGKAAPNPERQDTPHPHQVIEGEQGTFYVPDLGNDRVWVVERQGEHGLSIKGYLQCLPGDGPRHAVISPDGKHMYVLAELSKNIIVFPLGGTSFPVHPLPDFETSVLPPTAPTEFAGDMTSAELLQHPTIPGVLYASNRGELHIRDDKAKDVPGPQPEGDTVAICLLSADGSKFEQVTQVRTGCDAIRAMQISDDGNYVALAGQDGGGVEIWRIGGERGDVWKLAAKDETIAKITDFVWV